MGVNHRKLFVKYFVSQSLQFCKLDPQPHREKQQDPDPQKMNANPQAWPEDMVLKGDDRVHCVYCISGISHLIIYVSHEVSEKEIYFLCHKTQQQSSNNNILIGAS